MPLLVLATPVATLASPSFNLETTSLASPSTATPITVELLETSALLPTTVSDPPSADQETAGSLAPLVTSSEGPTPTPTLSKANFHFFRL